MNRRAMGRGAWIAGIAAALLVVACVLPWYTAGGGTPGIPPVVLRAFDGPGVAAFVAGLATIALVVLPFAAGDQPISIDHWISYLVLAILGTAGWVIQLMGYLGRDLSGLRPDRASGTWLAAFALIALFRAVVEVRAARR